ncbi:glycosyltransferase family 2 protein [Microbacterium sulfonylureivorans]|uniref:glycosyltransferase family 2 protein n=1 Tax=Microbacterium sulfonylureivorans TaxID=2486854 RepID=UPI0013E07E1C|nr:glycosyltransferase family 2 protein [Microbacterium sulfonylureivorans]
MLLTIGIPTYNRAEDVLSTVRDILAHADSDLVDIVVIDDGGSDGTFGRLMEDAEIARRVRVLRNDANLGYARTFARLFRECETEYLMLMADDDRVMMQSVRPLLDYLDRERPAFVSPQFIRESRVYRGRTTTAIVEPTDFLRASAHAPGLIYRVEDCGPGLDELLERAEAQEVDALVYPQVHVVMRLLLAERPCAWLALPTVVEGAYRPSGIRDAEGGAYWSLESRWKQLKSYDALLSRYVEEDTTGRAQEMLAAQRARTFHMIASAIRIEDPVLGDAFDDGARKRYERRPVSRIGNLPIVKWAARRTSRLRRR